MAYILFVDESGSDHKDSPYEVLAGIAVEDSRVWNLIVALRRAEEDCFGRRITAAELELKAKKLLKPKTFRLAEQMPALDPSRMRGLASACLEEGAAAHAAMRAAKVTRDQLTALGQAKVLFATTVIELLATHQVKVFASIVDRDAPRPGGKFLRKDYSYLLQRLFYFLEDQPVAHQGLVVFDELEKSRSHILVDQMAKYFQDTTTGRFRASRVIPEPFFVHSELTSLIQVADLVAYVIAWGLRFDAKRLTRPARPELGDLAKHVYSLRYIAAEREGRRTSSLAIIPDLRPLEEKELEGG